ncbi:hypothetical protein [Enterobacter cloacae]|uniref:hypothetical protein n=1 Tax=Enterobacter cloacae TaxID=550 RepID=UPI000643DB58|nr:hypothetical protein [Enterobacter cloacae]KLQ08987.1 hypothetical protein ABR35_20880 [Enterobacter cloacae subsp. cloacae]
MSKKYEDLIKNARMNAECGEHMSPEEVTTLLNVVETTFAALAAENAGLKAMCEDRRTFIMNGVQLGYIQVPTVETDPALETIRVAVSPQEPTPTTDAFLAEVRAHDLNAFIRHHSAELDAHIKNGGEQFDEKSVRIRDIIVSARLFREQIRKEAAQ